MTTGEIWLRGEGGAVFRMTEPISPHIRARWDAGHLQRVNPDGSLWTGETQAPRKPRARMSTADVLESFGKQGRTGDGT